MKAQRLIVIILWLSCFTVGLTQDAVLGDALLNTVTTDMASMRMEIQALHNIVGNLEAQLQNYSVERMETNTMIEELQNELEARTAIKVYYRGVDVGETIWEKEFASSVNPRSPLAYDENNVFEVELEVKRACTLLMIANGHIKHAKGENPAYLSFYVNGKDVGNDYYDLGSQGIADGFFYHYHATSWHPISFTQSHQITQEYLDADEQEIALRGRIPFTVDLRLHGKGGTFKINGLGMQVVSMGCE